MSQGLRWPPASRRAMKRFSLGASGRIKPYKHIRDPCQPSELQNCKIIDVCCLKPPSLWQFLTAVIENSYNYRKIRKGMCIIHILHENRLYHAY